MSSLASPRTGWWRPEDCTLWRAFSSGQGLTGDVRQLLGISIVDLTASLESPWEMTIREYIKPGHGAGTTEKVYGNRYFEPEQKLWLTDRNLFPNTANGPSDPDSTRLLFYGKIVTADINLEDGQPHYLYRVVDRRWLSRRVAVTRDGALPSDNYSSQGPSKLVFNPPPGDVDAGFDPLGGSQNTIFKILEKYFAIHALGLIAHADIVPTITLADFHGWRNEADTFVPGKIVIEDANFEEGLLQILGQVPYVRFYVDPLSAKFVFVSPLRLGQSLPLEMPSDDEPTRDYPMSSSWSINTEDVHTAVRITAKTGKIKNNWTRMVSGFGSRPEETSSGASVVPLQTPKQPGITVGITVNSSQSNYYEKWAALPSGQEGYWNYAGGPPNGLPVDGAGQPQPIYMLNMWNEGFELDFRGDPSGTWTGYAQTGILAGHYHGGSGQVAGQQCTITRARIADVPSTFAISGAGGVNGCFDFSPFDTGGAGTSYIYSLIDTQKYWRTAGMTDNVSGGVVQVNRRRRRGPWAGGRVVIPPQPGVPRPAAFDAAFGQFAPIKLDIQVCNGSDLWCTVIPEQQPYIHYNTWAGEIVGSKWYYEVNEPGNKLTGPGGKFYTTGGRWSAMYRTYRVFDPEMVWQFVNSHGGTNRPKFAAFAPEVCFVGITTRTSLQPAPGFTPPLPDPLDPGGAAAWKSQSSIQFFEIKARLGGSADIDAGMISTGAHINVDIVQDATPRDANGNPQAGNPTRYYPSPFDIQFGWVALGGGLQVRQPSSSYSGPGFTDYGIKREKVINVDLTEFQDVPEADQDSGQLGTRLSNIAEQTLFTLSKVPKVGQVTLYGLDFEHITYVVRPTVPTLIPFTYYLTLDVDQKDITPSVGAGTVAACVQVRINFEDGTTTLDLTEDRSGIQGDLVGKLISDFRSQQLLHDVRSTLSGFKAFRECIGAGNDPGGAAGTGTVGAGGGGSPCETFLPNPDGAGFINLCLLIYRTWILAKKGGGGGDPPEKQPQQAGAIMLRPGDSGMTPAGGSPQITADDDRNALTDIFDEIPPGYTPPIVEGDFEPRGAEFIYDAKNQRTVTQFYGKHNRYKWLGASLAADGIRWQYDSTIIPCDGGRINGLLTAFAKDFLGWERALDAELSEDEESAAGIYTTPSQDIGLRNTSFDRWRLHQPDEVPYDCALYLDFEEASGSLYDLSRLKNTFAVASGSPTYGVTGLITGELGITTVQGSSSFSGSVGAYPGYLPFYVLVRFKLNSTGISHTLASNFSATNGWKVEINTANKLVFTVGDGTNSCTVTHSLAMSAGTWYSFRCEFYRANIVITQSDGTSSTGTIGAVLKSISGSATLTISGSVTWDDFAYYTGSFGNHDGVRTLCPSSWKSTGPTLDTTVCYVSPDTSDANGGTAGAWISISSGSTTSPLLFYQDTAGVPDLALIPGHTYRLTVNAKRGADAITVAPWIENIDQRKILTSSDTFTDGDTALTLTVTDSAWTENVVTFTVPNTFNAWDRWRIGVRGSVATGAAVLKLAGDPAISLEEVDVNLTDTEYLLVDSDGVRVAELNADDAVVAQ